ncbi:MAG: hypothetical protein V1898_04520 [Patescibacteria group bacterium]
MSIKDIKWDKIFNLLVIIVLIIILVLVTKSYDIDYYKFFIIIIVILTFIYSLYTEWGTDNLNLKVLFNPWKLYSFFINRFLSEHIFHPSFFFPLSVGLVLYFLKKYNFILDEKVILFITFLAILWYTRETMVLRQAQQQIIEIEKEKLKK